MFLEPFFGGRADKRYVSSPVAKTLVWIENHDWAQLFLDVFLGLTLAGPKKASKSTILQNRLNKKKLLVDVANLATCCHDDYDVLLEVLGTLGKCYVSSLLGLTQPFRQRARECNESASRFPLTRARVGGKVVRPRRLY